MNLLLAVLSFGIIFPVFAQQTFTPINSKSVNKASPGLLAPAIIPSLPEHEENASPTMDGAWPGSCGGAAVKEYIEDALKSFPVENYFFFSLEQFNNSKSPESFRFFKDKNFSGMPAFQLDKDGLKKEGKLICKWDEPYSESNLFKNALPDCLKSYHQFLGFIEVHAENSERVDLCSVVKVSAYEKDSSGHFHYQVQIGDESYYIDVTNFKGLLDGSLFSTSAKRFLKSYLKTSHSIHTTTATLIRLKETDEFKKLANCFNEKDKECIMKSFQQSFLDDVAGRGSDPICNPNNSALIEKPACGPQHKEEILNAAFGYVKEFLDRVYMLKHENVTFDNVFFGPGNHLDISFEPIKTHKDTDIPRIDIKIKDGKIEFITFNDGRVC